MTIQFVLTAVWQCVHVSVVSNRLSEVEWIDSNVKSESQLANTLLLTKSIV